MNKSKVYLLNKIGEISAFSASVDCRFVENAQCFFEGKGIVCCKQTHSDNIEIVDEGMRGCEVQDCDALVTNCKNLPLMIRTADCVPVVLYDSVKKVIADIHAGRVGTQKGIVGKTVRLMQRVFSSDPADIVAVLGPHICGKCYEVDASCASEFGEEYVVGLSAVGKPLIDIAAANVGQLIDAGVLNRNISVSDICTAECVEWPSWRRGKSVERLGTFVCLL
ncbi:MAG: peptidoglycan editing factor PgeF [Paludibacteraceae bacterium]|nr:peptidoglycan editing factor PgeF [Paludibacteraceae bacterium]